MAVLNTYGPKGFTARIAFEERPEEVSAIQGQVKTAGTKARDRDMRDTVKKRQSRGAGWSEHEDSRHESLRQGHARHS